jgi:hypothetical protein
MPVEYEIIHSWILSHIGIYENTAVTHDARYAALLWMAQ